MPDVDNLREEILEEAHFTAYSVIQVLQRCTIALEIFTGGMD